MMRKKMKSTVKKKMTMTELIRNPGEKAKKKMKNRWTKKKEIAEVGYGGEEVEYCKNYHKREKQQTKNKKKQARVRVNEKRLRAQRSMKMKARWK
jgi:hypothetical protein